MSKRIKKFVDFLLTERLEELVKKYGKDEEYMAMVRTVEQLYTDPKYIGYYDVAEAERQEKEDIYLTGALDGEAKGRSSGLQEGRASGIKEGKAIRDEEIAKMMLQEKESIEKVLTSEGDIEDKVIKLIRKANNRGGTDNISVAYLILGEGEE